MPLPKGRTVKFSTARRFVFDVMHFSRGVPLVAVQRRIHIPNVIEARSQLNQRPGWYAIFLKAYALAGQTIPDLRRSLLTFPTLRLYEHACTVAAVTMEREHEGESTVFILQIRQADLKPLLEIDAVLKQTKLNEVRNVAAFRRALRLSRWPKPIRRFVWWLALRVVPRWREKYFGTFTASSTISSGVETVSALTPLSSYFTFDEVTDNGVTLRILFDHRVADAAPVSRYLVEMERRLNSDILTELQSLAASESQHV